MIDRAAEYLADCAVIIANALDVELLVIGGKAVTHVAEIYKEKVTEFLASRPLARKTHTLEVAISDMANDGAALGAASLGPPRRLRTEHCRPGERLQATTTSPRWWALAAVFGKIGPPTDCPH